MTLKNAKPSLSFFLGCLFVFVSVNSSAIQVQVQSKTPVSAIGFKVNGQNFGGTGSEYYKKDAPFGQYIFGLRANGLFSQDIRCYTAHGEGAILLRNDVKAVLEYDGRNCLLKLYQ